MASTHMVVGGHGHDQRDRPAADAQPVRRSTHDFQAGAPSSALPVPLGFPTLTATILSHPIAGRHHPATVLHLQRTHGNRAVQQILQRPHDPGGSDSALHGAMIQRALGDGHDLTSPRFAGDPTLEACFDDQARLGVGARGESVTKVQGALVDLGSDLGPSGADGIYGNRTANAVKKFKADQQLGFEQFGDVGPGTMGRLNELFPGNQPAAPPPPAAEEGEQLSCPTEDVIVTALESRPETASAFVGQQLTAAPETAAPDVAAPGAHVSIDEAVARFKAKVNAKIPTTANPDDAGGNISDWGQFFWAGQMKTAVTNELDRMAGEPTAADFVLKARAARDAIMARNNARAAQLLGELDAIAASTKSPEKAAMQAMLRKHPVTGGGLDTLLWEALGKRPDDSVPSAEIARFRSLRTLQTLLAFDSQACGFHAGKVAARLKQKGGIVARDKTVASFPGARLATGAGIRDRRPMGSPARTFEPEATAAVTPGSSLMLGDHIFQSGVLGAVAGMQKALDAGQLIHARVLSGVGYGGFVGGPSAKAKPFRLGPPPEEHSLLIIGFDGSTFVFHDPDAGVSHDPEGGFGKLRVDLVDDRLSTATGPADMPVDEDGKHRSGNKRYQIISLSPI